MYSRSRWHRWLIRLRRWGVATVLITAYIAAAFGFPLPTRVQKDLSQPFPCQDHPCGCQNAEQCWHHCCCFSAEEKLAWARSHRVEPPASVRSELANLSWRSKRLRDEAEQCESRCPCAATSNSHACCASTTERDDYDKPGHRWVLAVLAHKCQGQGLWCQAVFLALPPPAIVPWSYDWQGSGIVPPFRFATYQLSFAPPTPPPRDARV